MAKTRFWVEIVCIDCADTHHGSCRFVFGSAIPVREMSALASRDGWQHLNNGQHRCPKCTKDVLASVGVVPEASNV